MPEEVEEEEEEDDDDVPEQKGQWGNMAIPEKKKRISLSYWTIKKIKTKEDKAVKTGQLFGTRQHNHATVCLASKSIKNITFRLQQILWVGFGVLKAMLLKSSLPGCQPVSTGKQLSTFQRNVVPPKRLPIIYQWARYNIKEGLNFQISVLSQS